MAYVPPNVNGQATMANSAPVVIASNQSAVPTSSASLPLPTGAATAAKQPALGTAGAASTDVITVQGIASGVAQPVSLATAPTTPVTGTFWQATQPVSLATNTPTIAAGSAIIGKVGIDQTTAGTTNGVSIAQLGTVTISTGNGVSGTGVQRVSIASDSTGQIAPAANATATGFTTNQQNTLTNTKIAVKAAAGNMYGYRLYNPNTSYVYIQLFNALTGSVTLGTTSPTEVIPVPPGGLIDETYPVPAAYNTGIVIAATTTATGLTAPASSLVATVRYL